MDTFPSTVTTQWRLPWPRMATTLSYYTRTMTDNYTMHYFFTLCLNVCHSRLLKVPFVFVENFIAGHRRVSSARSSSLRPFTPRK